MKHIPLQYWAQFNHEHAAPGRMMLGELLDGDPSAVSKVWREGGFTSMFDFPLAFAMTDVFCRDSNVAKLAAVLTNDRRYPDPSALVTMVDNHDLPRIATSCRHDPKRIESALRFLLSMRGIPSLTWGTEVGLDGDKEPETRKSMEFTHSTSPVKAEITRALTTRSDSPALRDGALVILELDSHHLVIGRAHADQLAVVAVNQSATPFSWSSARAGEPWPVIQSAPPGVTVTTSGITPGRFTELARSVDAQWRTGATTTRVTFKNSNGVSGRVVGSGEVLGDWSAAAAPALPAELDLPTGGVFEFKFISATGVWEEGENRVLVVPAGTMTVEPPYRSP